MRGVEEATGSREDEGEEGDGLAPMQRAGAAPAFTSGEGTFFHLEEESKRQDRGGRTTLQMRSGPFWQRVKQMKRGMLYVAFVLTPKTSSFPLRVSSYKKLWETVGLLNAFGGGP